MSFLGGGHKLTLLWVALVLATAASYTLRVEGGAGIPSMVIITVAFVKIRVVGLHFMELRTAPLPLRLIFEGYVAVALLTMLGLYLAF